jgi:hypothetical protein
VLSWLNMKTSATTAASQRRVLFPRYFFHLPESRITKLTRVVTGQVCR